PLSVINALIVSLCMKKQQNVIETLENLEEIWDEYQVYNNDEIDIPDDHMQMKLKQFGDSDE
ncbi:MAG: N-acetylmannosamine kinase, partial [Lachnospiraceae bacterium]|nr:N-acetylmannosamine kinase [Lachnospiraceae bacterium]